MNCKWCGEAIEQAEWSDTGWTHKTTGLVCYRHAEPEVRPADDPAPIPTCSGRDCGGRPHE